MTDLNETLASHGLSLERRQCAEGGTAWVHKARTTRSGGTSAELPPEGSFVAVKEFKPATLEIPGQGERIAQEAELGRQIRHPNVVQYYKTLEQSSDRVLVAMEWVDGQPLSTWNAEHDPKDWDARARVLVQLVDGLEALHTANVLHRDIKAENVMVLADGSAKLMDLGIVLDLADEAATMHTQVKDFIGSIRFASPQFVRGEAFAAADDVYALGTVVFELATGQRVYDDVERKTLLPFEILRSPPKVESLRDGVPPSTRVLIAGMLSPSQKRRPSLQELRDALIQPESSTYVQRELDAQNNDKRTYEVVAVEDSGNSIFADLRGKQVQGSDAIVSVVRRSTPVKVPSIGSTVTPEQWVADVRLKHISQGVGHFVRVVRRWHESDKPSPFSSLGLMEHGGRWEYHEVGAQKVRVGDVIVANDDY